MVTSYVPVGAAASIYMAMEDSFRVRNSLPELSNSMTKAMLSGFDIAPSFIYYELPIEASSYTKLRDVVSPIPPKVGAC